MPTVSETSYALSSNAPSATEHGYSVTCSYELPSAAGYSLPSVSETSYASSSTGLSGYEVLEMPTILPDDSYQLLPTFVPAHATEQGGRHPTINDEDAAWHNENAAHVLTHLNDEPEFFNIASDSEIEEVGNDTYSRLPFIGTLPYSPCCPTSLQAPTLKRFI